MSGLIPVTPGQGGESHPAHGHTVENAGKPKLEEREAFASWLATPKKERTPTTQVELAQQLGVNNVTLTRWKNEDRDVAKRVLHLVSIKTTSKHADIVGKLVDRCMDGDVKAIEVYFKWCVLTSMEFTEEKEQVNAFKRTLEIFQSGRLSEMIDAIQSATKAKAAVPVEATVESIAKPNFEKEITHVETENPGPETKNRVG